jgi:hypothetical protein
MANYCCNTITIKGDQITLKNIYHILKRESEDGLFERLVGTRPGITKEEYNSNAYNINLEDWGCRSDVDVDFHYELSDGELTLHPDTPYSPPIEFCRTLCVSYNVDIHMFYYGIEDDFCGVTTLTKEGFTNEEDYDYLDGLYIFGEMDLFWSEIESRMEIFIEDEDEDGDVEMFITDFAEAVSDETKNEIREMFQEQLELYKN